MKNIRKKISICLSIFLSGCLIYLLGININTKYNKSLAINNENNNESGEIAAVDKNTKVLMFYAEKGLKLVPSYTDKKITSFPSTTSPTTEIGYGCNNNFLTGECIMKMGYAITDSRYEFKGWSTDNCITLTKNPYYVTTYKKNNRAYTIKACSGLKQGANTSTNPNLSVTASSGVSLSIASKSTNIQVKNDDARNKTFICGNSNCYVNLKVTVQSGYKFLGWSNTGNCNNNTYSSKDTELYHKFDSTSNDKYIACASPKTDVPTSSVTAPTTSTTESSNSGLKTICTIDVPKNTTNKNNFYETWEIYDNDKFMLAGGTGTTAKYQCKYDNCYIKFTKLDNKRTFNGIAGDGNCSTGGRNGTKETKILKCTNYVITAKACYTDEYVNNSSSPTVTEPIVPNDNTESINKYVYAKGGEYSGNTIACGDKIYVTTCKNNICNVTTINGKEVSSTTQIKKSNYVLNESETGCFQKIKRYVSEKTYYYTNSGLTEGKTEIDCGSKIEFTKSIDTACTSLSCEVNYNNKKVYIDKNKIVSDKPVCSNSAECVTSNQVLDLKSDIIVRICKKDDNEETLNTIVTCAQDYFGTHRLSKDTCSDKNDENCYKEYKYTCEYVKRPWLSATAGILNQNGKGTINIIGYDNGNVGLKGYYISDGDAPTQNSNWKSYENSDYKAQEEKTAGTYFVWTMNNKDRISYEVLTKVIDPDLTTTLKTFSAVDENNASINIEGIDKSTVGTIYDSKYALLSNNLISDSVLGGFDSLTTAYEINTMSNKVALYATLTSEDATYVAGYEPRTIDLEYGRNVALIKIVNNKGKERTYTFIINRVDDRNNSNLLSNITLSKGKIEFDPYTTNYDVTIPKNTKVISINAELNSSKAMFIKGYEPREVQITEDTQSAVLKVKSEAGNIRSYVITFIKKGKEIEDNKSTYLSSLSVPGTQLGFDKNVFDYTITVPYEVEDIPIYAFAESESSKVNVGNNLGLNVGNNLIEIEVENNNNIRIYSLHVIRKESGLDISNSAKLSMLSVKNYKINFNPDEYDYEVKIKRDKTLLITASPENNNASVYVYGNKNLTGFSTVRVKVIAENGYTSIYSIDIQKNSYNKVVEIITVSVSSLVIIILTIIIIKKRKIKTKKEYMEG